MARTSLIHKQKRTPKFSSRKYNRCNRCSRARSFLRRFGICRICFRELASNSMIPGVRKSSW